MNNRVLTYIFFGALTTLVNIGSYLILRKNTRLDLNICNIIAIMIAIIFSYIMNKYFVFQTTGLERKKTIKEFFKFIEVRVLAMFIEVIGVYVLVNYFLIQDSIGKILIQFIVLILNYIFSKYFVFAKE